MDNRTPKQRRQIMQAVKTKNTAPEITVRSALHALGYRFRLHRNDLPGKPDIVLPRHKKAIFVHGCFWHAHDCPKGRPPKSRLDYWLPKLEKNVQRDKTNIEQLAALGWDVLVIWQCEVREADFLAAKLQNFVDNPKTRSTSSSSGAILNQGDINHPEGL